MKGWLAFLCLIGIPFLPAGAQDSSSVARGWQASLHYGAVIAHSNAVANTRDARPVGIELVKWRQQRGQSAFDICNCYPRSGWMLSYYQFNNIVLGQGAMAAYLLEPQYRLGNRLHFSMRGAAGLAWASNPYNAITNPDNQSYSTAVSAYLLYGLGLQYQLNQRWSLQVAGNFQHISNGGLRQPNKGINWPTAQLGLQYSSQPVAYYRGARQNDPTLWRGKPWRKDIAVFGMAKRYVNPNGSSSRYPLGGIMLQGSKQVGRTNAITVGTEWSADQGLQRRLDADTAADGNSIRGGLLLGHEFLLGRFIFSQRIGVYVYQPNPYYDTWFHRWGLQYRFARQWWAGFNLKAHRHVADFIDLRLVYSWQ